MVVFSNGSRNTSKAPQKGKQNDGGESERDHEWGEENQSVLTVVLVWDWTGREALEETGACFCSDDCREK